MTRVVAGVLAVSIAIASCAGDDADERVGPPSGEAEDLQRASEALCEAAIAASTGDPQAAARAFEDEAHAYLHELAARLQGEDREVAARLLEAKSEVERELEDPGSSDPVALTAAITDLQRALARAAAAAGLPRPRCAGGSS